MVLLCQATLPSSTDSEMIETRGAAAFTVQTLQGATSLAPSLSLSSFPGAVHRELYNIVEDNKSDPGRSHTPDKTQRRYKQHGLNKLSTREYVPYYRSFLE